MTCYKYIFILNYIPTATKLRKDLMNNPHGSGDIEFQKNHSILMIDYPQDLQLITNNSTPKHPHTTIFELELAAVMGRIPAKFHCILIITITMLHRTCVFATESSFTSCTF